MIDTSYINEHTIPAIIAVIYCFLLYLDSKINNCKRTGRDYFKAFIILYSLSYFTIYLYNNYVINKPVIEGGGVFKNSPVREEIYIGNPNF